MLHYKKDQCAYISVVQNYLNMRTSTSLDLNYSCNDYDVVGNERSLSYWLEKALSFVATSSSPQSR